MMSCILLSCHSGADVIGTANNKDTATVEQAADETQNEIRMVTDYASIPLERLVGMADLIVTGSVGDVEENVFEFNVAVFMTRPLNSNKITVAKYVPPEIFAPGIVVYEKGQRFALFLASAGSDRGPWIIIGYAGEGELPIEDGFVYFEPYDLEGLEYGTSEVHGITTRIQSFGLADFEDAVRGYRQCFSWKLKGIIKNMKKRERWVPSKVCSDETIAVYRAKSWLHDYLTENTMRRIGDGNH